MRWFRERREGEPFVPKKEVYWLGRYCPECGMPRLSDPKVERHAEQCQQSTNTSSFRTRIVTKGES